MTKESEDLRRHMTYNAVKRGLEARAQARRRPDLFSESIECMRIITTFLTRCCSPKAIMSPMSHSPGQTNVERASETCVNISAVQAYPIESNIDTAKCVACSARFSHRPAPCYYNCV